MSIQSGNPRPDEQVEVQVQYAPGKTYRAVRRFDPDVFELLDASDWEGARELLRQVCHCGDLRADHMAATGALGSFAGNACDKCWVCGTFTAVAA